MIEPPPSAWNLAGAPLRVGEEVVAVGGDLEPGTILEGYRHGLFPMGLGRQGGRPLGWWCPVRRGVLLPGDFHVSRSLRRSHHRFEVTLDSAFSQVVAGCADPTRVGRWITREVAEGYARLHELGWAHSVEVWSEGELVGGLYGVAVGGLFAGESMFHQVTDASKFALWTLSEVCFADGAAGRLIDVQWQTPHLATLGVREISRENYLERLPRALALPVPDPLRDPVH